MATTVKIDKLIDALQDIKDRYGNLFIVLACDSEENSFGTINLDRVRNAFTLMSNVCVLSPYQDNLEDVTEIKGYKNNERTTDSYGIAEEDEEEECEDYNDLYLGESDDD